MPDQKNVQANTQLPSLPDALCDLLHEGSFNHAAAVGIYLCHLEETISHPHDSAWRDDQLDQLEKALGESSQAVESQARSLFAAKCLCRLLQREEASVGPDDVTTIECSSQMDELKGLMDAFGWGFPSESAITTEAANNIRYEAVAPGVTDDASASIFVDCDPAQMRAAVALCGPGAKVTGKDGRTATFLGCHPVPGIDGWFWWRIAEPAEHVASVHNPFRECDDVYDAAAGAVRAINARLARRGLQLVPDDAEAIRDALVGGLQDSEVEEAQ